MKVNDLRQLLKELPAEEVLKLAVEIYKSVPKSKKDALDAYLKNPQQKKKPTAEVVPVFDDLAYDLGLFMRDARDGGYLSNKLGIPLKARKNWRFAAMRFFKLLKNPNLLEANYEEQAALLLDYYAFLLEAYDNQYFRAADPFESTRIDRVDGFDAVIDFAKSHLGIHGILPRLIAIATHPCHYFDECQNLIEVLLSHLELYTTKELALNKVLEQIELQTLQFQSTMQNHPKIRHYQLANHPQSKSLQNLCTLLWYLHSDLHQEQLGLDTLYKYWPLKAHTLNELFYVLSKLNVDVAKKKSIADALLSEKIQVSDVIKMYYLKEKMP
ncbi:MAG: hypothetical protein LAT76_05650 [Schleiferiaceae bacterium]|nr:hypothetical protein [Schleiferiaceae bacterium]